MHVYVSPVCGAASWAGNADAACYGVTALSRHVCHIHTSSFFKSEKVCNTVTRHEKTALHLRFPRVTAFPRCYGRDVTAMRDVPDRGTPRHAAACLKRPVPGRIPARAARAPPTSRTAAPAKRLPRPNRGAPPRAGTCVPRPQGLPPIIPVTPPEGAAARVPPRASRKRAQMLEHWWSLP